MGAEEFGRNRNGKCPLCGQTAWNAVRGGCLCKSDWKLLAEAMHMLLYIDAHMESERMPLAKKIAKVIGHPWPPYPDAKDDDDDDDDDYENPGAHGTDGGPDL